MRILRGAVFFVAMSTWGSQRVPHLCFPFVEVLPHLQHAVGSGNKAVVYEILLSLRRLIRKYGEDLTLEWPMILRILRTSQPIVMGEWESSLVIVARDTLSLLALLAETSRSNLTAFGTAAELMLVFRSFLPCLPEACVDLLFTHMADIAHPASCFVRGKQTEWCSGLEDLLKVFLLGSHTCTRHRMAALDVIGKRISSFQDLYGPMLIRTLLVPTLRILLLQPPDTDTSISWPDAPQKAAETPGSEVCDHALTLLGTTLQSVLADQPAGGLDDRGTTVNAIVGLLSDLCWNLEVSQRVDPSVTSELVLAAARSIIRAFAFCVQSHTPAYAQLLLDAITRLLLHPDIAVRLAVVEFVATLRIDSAGRLRFATKDPGAGWTGTRMTIGAGDHICWSGRLFVDRLGPAAVLSVRAVSLNQLFDSLVDCTDQETDEVLSTSRWLFVT